MADYKPTITCPKCNLDANRDFIADKAYTSVKLAQSEIKTIGHLAQRNTEKFSNDYKEHLYRKHNEYRFKEPEKEPPRGMRRLTAKEKESVEWV